MTNLLDLVPSLERQLRVYVNDDVDTPSHLAGYLADGIDAFTYFRPKRGYVITYTSPYTYVCDPDILVIDRRPLILMASIIYKKGNINLAAISDGDFSYNPFPRGKTTTVDQDVEELKAYLPEGPPLAIPSTSSLIGFNNVFNRESYDWANILFLFR